MRSSRRRLMQFCRIELKFGRICRGWLWPKAAKAGILSGLRRRGTCTGEYRSGRIGSAALLCSTCSTCSPLCRFTPTSFLLTGSLAPTLTYIWSPFNAPASATFAGSFVWIKRCFRGAWNWKNNGWGSTLDGNCQKLHHRCRIAWYIRYLHDRLD